MDEQPLTLEVLPGAFRTSKDIDAISAAFAEAQTEFESAKKHSANPAYRSKYADLTSIIDAVLEPLNKHGIGVLQPWRLEKLNGTALVTVTTRLQHKSGQYFETEASLPAVQRDRFDAQSVGSAVTYGRRYSLQSLVCLAAEDDDGNLASGVGSKEAAQEVGRRKVAELQANRPAGIPVTTLFYTYKENNAEFFNYRAYSDSLSTTIAQEGLKAVFKKHGARMPKDGSLTPMILRTNMQALLEDLVGSVGADVKELKANDAQG